MNRTVIQRSELFLPLLVVSAKGQILWVSVQPPLELQLFPLKLLSSHLLLSGMPLVVAVTVLPDMQLSHIPQSPGQGKGLPLLAMLLPQPLTSALLPAGWGPEYGRTRCGGG